MCRRGAHLKALKRFAAAKEIPVGQNRHQKRLKRNVLRRVDAMKK
jgi:hypothetical protein